MEKADIIIPVYKPDGKFLTLIEKLGKQSVLPNRIIIMNTEQKYYDRLIYGTSFQKEHRDMVVKHLSRREFDHGRTRNRGVQYSDTDFFIMMTQDAVPADEYLVERLLEQLGNENVAVAYARQLADGDSSEIEKYTRNFNYPEQSKIKTKADLETLGIKTFFCSNVCAAYNRKIFDKLGGFVKHTIFNEDMIYAAGCIRAGYKIAYTAEAKVIHSHQYTNKEQFRRNFDLGVSQAEHPEVFESVPAESEGIRLVKRPAEYLKTEGEGRLILPMCVTSAYKFFGYKLGKNYKRLSFRRILKYTMNRTYWESMRF